MAILKSNTTRKMLAAFMAARPAAEFASLNINNAGQAVGETVRRLDAEMKSTGKKSFTIADIRRIRNGIYTGNGEC